MYLFYLFNIYFIFVLFCFAFVLMSVFNAFHNLSAAQMVAYTGGQVKDIINARNSSNETALDVACRYSQDRGVKMLLEAGASVDEVQADSHALPIHTAMKSRSDRCAEILLEFHPEQLEAKDTKYGGSPLHWAKTKEVRNFLIL